MKKQFKKKEDALPLNFFILGIVLIALSIIGIFFIKSSLIPFTLIMILPGIFLVSVRFGMIIDFDEKVMIKYWRIFSKRFEKRVSLEKVKYLSLVNVRLQDHFSSKACTYHTVEILCKLNLVISRKDYIPFSYEKKKQALDQAKKIANGLNLRILDMTSGKEEWIEPEIAIRY